MTKKKTWKARAKRADRQADELLSQLQARAAELQVIDEALATVEFPGPTLEDWAKQMSGFLMNLVKIRGINSGWVHRGMLPMAVPIPNIPKQWTGEVPEDGIKLPTAEEIAADFTAKTNVPAGGGRFA